MKIIYLPLLLLFTVPHTNAGEFTDKARAKREVDVQLRQRHGAVVTNTEGDTDRQAVLVSPDDDDYNYEFDKGIRDKYLCLAGWMGGTALFALCYWLSHYLPLSLNYSG